MDLSIVTGLAGEIGNLTNAGGTLLFAANDGIHGTQPWILGPVPPHASTPAGQTLDGILELGFPIDERPIIVRQDQRAGLCSYARAHRLFLCLNPGLRPHRCTHLAISMGGVGKVGWVPCFRGTRRASAPLWGHPESMPASKRTACFRGDSARAMLLWAIRESMAPSEPKRCVQR